MTLGETELHELLGDPRESSVRLTAGEAAALLALFAVAETNGTTQLAQLAAHVAAEKAHAFTSDLLHAILRLYDVVNRAAEGELSLEIGAVRAKLDQMLGDTDV